MARPALRVVLDILSRNTSVFNPMNHVRLSHVLHSENVATREFEQPYVRPPYEEAMIEKEIKIKTCGHLFEDYHRQKKFWSIPKGDIQFQVKYIDTGIQDRPLPETPIVLALHGSPGSYKDFDAIISHIYHKGARIIAPLFPGSDNIQLRIFRHTPEEKSEYVKDFLRMLGLSRIDMLICHSSALFPGQLLCLADIHVRIKSLCLLNPTAFDIPRIMRPYWLYYALIRMYEFDAGRSVTDFIGQYLTNKPQLKGGRYHDHFLSGVNMVHSSIPKQRVHFERLLKRNLPIMLAYGEDDKLISKKSSLKMAKMMIDDDEIFRYDKNGKLCTEGGLNPMRKVLAFENGSHFVFKRHPDIICNEISSFLFQHFVKNSKLVQRSFFAD